MGKTSSVSLQLQSIRKLEITLDKQLITHKKNRFQLTTEE